MEALSQSNGSLDPSWPSSPITKEGEVVKMISSVIIITDGELFNTELIFLGHLLKIIVVFTSCEELPSTDFEKTTS